MKIYLDERTFDSHILDTENKGIIAENFTYLIKNLMTFIDPQYKYEKVKQRLLRGGPRRMKRGEREWVLPYTIDFVKTEVGAQVLGSKIDLDVWKVSHPKVEDPTLGEVYPRFTGRTPDVVPADKRLQIIKGQPISRGPYTVRMTARQDIINKKGTRTYVECTCDDFKATFSEKLNDESYTNPTGLPRHTTSKALSPAMCKHIYAIFTKEYRDIIAKSERWQENTNAELFGGPDESAEEEEIQDDTTDVDTTVKNIAKTKQEALALIKAELQKVHSQHKNDPKAYFDPRAGMKLPYHQYMFFVIQVNKEIRAIAYRNKAISGGVITAPFALLEIPDNPKIWTQFFKLAKGSYTTRLDQNGVGKAIANKHPDFEVLWNMIRELGPMPPTLKKSLEKQLGHEMHMFEDVESMIDMSLIETKNSNILASISELS